jgi:cytochrome P450
MDTLPTPFDTDPGVWHETLAAMRRTGPVHQIALPNGAPAWMITAYPEARAALGDPRLASPTAAQMFPDGLLPPDIRASLAHGLLQTDPPDHTRLRKLVSSVFTARHVELLRPEIESIAGRLLDAVADRDEFEVLDALGFPFPMEVICRLLLGVPAADVPKVRSWTEAYVSATGAVVFPAAELTEFVEFLRALVKAKRERPDDRLLSALAAARDQGERLSDDELTSTAALLLAAGFETTTYLIGNALYHFLSEPGLADWLRADPERIPAAVEEILRYDGVVTNTAPRFAAEPIELGGTTIPQGGMVLFNLLAANRDENVFTEANRLLPERNDRQQHLGFGYGVHFCIGALLARLEMDVAVRAVLDRFPKLRLAQAPQDAVWRLDSIFVRGLAGLPVTGCR